MYQKYFVVVVVIVLLLMASCSPLNKRYCAREEVRDTLLSIINENDLGIRNAIIDNTIREILNEEKKEVFQQYADAGYINITPVDTLTSYTIEFTDINSLHAEGDRNQQIYICNATIKSNTAGTGNMTHYFTYESYDLNHISYDFDLAFQNPKAMIYTISVLGDYFEVEITEMEVGIDQRITNYGGISNYQEEIIYAQ